MNRRIRVAAASVMVAAGLIGAVAAPASAAPKTLKPAAVQCTLQGGEFVADGPVGAVYLCRGGSENRAARAICEGAYGGTVVRLANEYDCVKPTVFQPLS